MHKKLFSVRVVALLWVTLLLIASCKSSEKVVVQRIYGKPYLGIIYEPMRNGGVVVVDIFPESPAEKYNIQIGDLIVKANNQYVAGATSLRTQIQSMHAGERVTLEIQDLKGDIRKVHVELDEIPHKLPLPRNSKQPIGIEESEPIKNQ